MLKITKLISPHAFFFALLFSSLTYAQVGIGTTLPSGGSVLDITSTDKGIIVPRVNITNLTTIAPITGGATVGLLVWNTNVGTGTGFHYWDGGDWIPLGGSISNDWALAGNTITAADFLGTINTQDLRIRTDNTLRARVLADGRMIVNELGGPYFADDIFTAEGIFAVNGYTTNGIGVYGEGTTGNGVAGASVDGFGVDAFSLNNTAVFGDGGFNGVVGLGLNRGVLGDAGASVGVQGQSTSGIGTIGIATTGTGVLGQATDDVGFGGDFSNTAAAGNGLIAAGNNEVPFLLIGGSGVSGTGTDLGVLGHSTAASSTAIVGSANGVLPFTLLPNGSGVAGTGTDNGVFGIATGAASLGVFGSGGTAAGGIGVQGEGFDGVVGIGDVAAGVGVVGDGADGVVGISQAPITNWGVFSVGDLGATGFKLFVLDHPLDPENKILKHANIESNEILNLYRGKEVFNSQGKAIVSLPDYYEAININASYQLTPIGAAMPNLFIEKEVENGEFIVAGGVPGKKVSWQITAERNDAYLQKYPSKRNMVIDKGDKRGKYLDPLTHNKSLDLSYFYNSDKKAITKQKAVIQNPDQAKNRLVNRAEPKMEKSKTEERKAPKKRKANKQ